MCGFLTVYSEDPSILARFAEPSSGGRYLPLRGPDETTEFRDGNWYWRHYLLAIRGHVGQLQRQGSGTLAWNGEMYHLPHGESDTLWLEQFLSFGGLSELTVLDGEFVICYRQGDHLHLITDHFGTKPASFICRRGVTAVASYPSVLTDVLGTDGLVTAEPNTHYILNTRTGGVACEPIYEWDFEPRYDHLERWLAAFEASLAKRAPKEAGKVALGLSSGYDSGAIAAELLRQGRPVHIYVVPGTEDHKLLAERCRVLLQHGWPVTIFSDMDRTFDSLLVDYGNMVQALKPRTEHGSPFQDMRSHHGGPLLHQICKQAREDGCKIVLTGTGADEIISDYSLIPDQSDLKGKYAGVRKPWINFGTGHMRDYLHFTERIVGASGMESRYPILDRQLTQEFLWLADEVKDREYKQCLAELFRRTKFPWAGTPVKMPMSVVSSRDVCRKKMAGHFS